MKKWFARGWRWEGALPRSLEAKVMELR